MTEFTALSKPVVRSGRDGDILAIASTRIPDQRVMDREIAKALGLEKDMTAEAASADALFYEALEATNAEARGENLGATLAKNPRHIDAHVELATLCADDNMAFYLLSRAIEYGEEDLKDELENDAGNFWGLHHTRPFMRAKQAIAERYFAAGQLVDAAYEMEEMLRLNPNDNQGMRWMLMQAYCLMDRLDDAEGLLREYPDDGTPFLPFTGLLIRFRKEGDSPQLRMSLREQTEWNPHIIPRLLEPSLISHESIAMFSPQSPEEADLYCQQFLSVWKSTPGAITWLRSAARDLPSPDIELSVFDIKTEIQKLRTKVKRLDSGAETWFCDANNVSRQEDDDGWLLTVVEKSAGSVVCLEPGKDPLGPDTVLFALLNTMLTPEDGPPRRPSAIEFSDVGLHQSLNKRLERLGITSNTTDERPEVLDFIERIAPTHTEPMEVDVDEIRSTPVSFETWEIDWRPLEQWLPNEENGELTQPWMILVAGEEDLILSQQLLLTPPDSDAILNVIGQAVLSPPVGAPSRPTTIRVPSAEHQLDVKPVADTIGIECIVGPCQFIDQMFESLSQHMSQADGGPPALVSLPDVTPEMVGDFYEAAADFYKSRVWTSTYPETVIEVRCNELIQGGWYAVIMGQLGQEIGIIFFDDRETLDSVFASDPSDPGAGAKQMHGIAFSLNEQQWMHPGDVAAVEQFGWPVAAPEAWPMGYFISGGALRPLDRDELQFLSAATRAVTEQLRTPASSLITSVALQERVVSVSTIRE